MNGLCGHGQNASFCLECWRVSPTSAPEKVPAVAERPRIVHFACGCRAAILEGGEIGSYSDKGCEEEGHGEMGRIDGNGAVRLPQSRRWLVHELLATKPHVEHAFRDRKQCDQPGCERWNPKERA